jgi:WhiB family redox-sensing transcriptional regulator
VWKPATNLDWQIDSLCAKAEHRDSRDWFFSKEPKEKYDAKNLCFGCPVRKQCLQWALEHRQIWGIWGGKDEVEIRRALSVSYKGEEARRRRFPNCPYCSARPSKLETSSVEVPGGGRWTVAKIVTCNVCNFSWRSRTSFNAVELYNVERLEKIEKRIKEKEKKARKNSKNSATKQPRSKLNS